jgi:hypothetical protein
MTTCKEGVGINTSIYFPTALFVGTSRPEHASVMVDELEPKNQSIPSAQSYSSS